MNSKHKQNVNKFSLEKSLHKPHKPNVFIIFTSITQKCVRVRTFTFWWQFLLCSFNTYTSQTTKNKEKERRFKRIKLMQILQTLNTDTDLLLSTLSPAFPISNSSTSVSSVRERGSSLQCTMNVLVGLVTQILHIGNFLRTKLLQHTKSCRSNIIKFEFELYLVYIRTFGTFTTSTELNWLFLSIYLFKFKTFKIAIFRRLQC